MENFALAIVLYNPKAEDISYLQGISLLYDGVIVDNSNKAISNPSFGKMEYIPLLENKGIAYAHNIALKKIFAQKEKQYAILLDQDSRLPKNYPGNIVESFIAAENSNIGKIATIGPSVINKTNDEEYKSIFHKDHRLTKDFIIKPGIIASGACINKEAFNTIGPEDERLFIDFVDTEWCFRAQSKGYICGIAPSIKLHHKVGQKEIHFGKHIVSVSAPQRYYYQYRNYISLCKRCYIPLWFKLNTGFKWFLRLFYLPFYTSSGIKTFKYMIKGICHGVIGKSGPLQ